MTLPFRRLRVPDEVAKSVRGMHPELKRKTRASLKTILADPSSGKALKDELAGLRSFQVGTFRVIYRVAGNIVEIVAIGPRIRIYDETYRLLKSKKFPPNKGSLKGSGLLTVLSGYGKRSSMRGPQWSV